MRYRKSVKICKGVRVNFSKSGPSVTVGGRGCSVNFGNKGTYLNTGIPGTGFYDRKKIGGASTSRSNAVARSNKTSSKQTAKHTEYRQFTVFYDDDASIIIKDSNGITVTDQSILRQIRASEEYKGMVEQASQKRLQEYNDRIESFVGIYKDSCEVLPIDSYRAGISDIRNSVYKAAPYDIPEPTDEQVRAELEVKAKKEISTIQFWKKNQLVQEYVECNLRQALAEKWIEWKNEKDIFEKLELEKEEKSLKESFEQQQQLIKLLCNEEDVVADSIDSWLKTLEFPFEFALDYEIRDKELWVDLDLPEIEDMPLKYAQQMANGTVKIKNRSKKDNKEDYYKCVLGLAVFFATHLMGCAIGIETVVISAYTQRPNNKGIINDDYIYSIKFDRNQLIKP